MSIRGSFQIEIGDVPPSLNRMGARGNPRIFHRHKKRWQQDVEMLLLAARTTRPLPPPVTVEAVLRFPVRRTRDEGNFRVLLEKATGDALVNGGWLSDDAPEHYRFKAVTFDPDIGVRRTLLTFYC
jgi:hypothetical protein